MGLTRRTVALLTIVMVVAAGCTQRETPEQYENKVSESYQQRRTLIISLATDGDAQYYLKAREAFQEDVDELRDIVPPKDVEHGHEKYIASLEGMVTVLQTLADCKQLQKSNFEAGRNCVFEISTSDLDQIENDFREAETVFEDRGYRLDGVSTGEKTAG